MSHVEEVARKLALDALAQAEATGDTKIVDQVGELLGASSQSLQEAYLQVVRVSRAEARARALMAEALPAAKAAAPAPAPAPASPPEAPGKG